MVEALAQTAAVAFMALESTAASLGLFAGIDAAASDDGASRRHAAAE